MVFLLKDYMNINGCGFHTEVLYMNINGYGFHAEVLYEY